MFNIFKRKKKTKPKKVVRRGWFYSWNSWKSLGHKGRVVNVKNGKAKVVLVTHSPKTLGQTNIALQHNPDNKDPRKAYTLKYPQEIPTEKVGKPQPKMKVRGGRDKAVFRNIGKKKKLFPLKKRKVFNKNRHKKK